VGFGSPPIFFEGVMSTMHWRVWLGFDPSPHETTAFAVARESIRYYAPCATIHGLVLSDLQNRGLYYRETTRRLGKLWDTISNAPMSTEFAISRFLIPEIARRLKSSRYRQGWAIYLDCDVLVRTNLTHMINLLDGSKALYCVKHNHVPSTDIKMDGQLQTTYPRKNWSSVMAINLDHPANKRLTVEMVNTFPGRDLHRFCWLDDEEIGELSPVWNYLVGHTQTSDEPKIVHFTDGIPSLNAYRNVEYADEWFHVLDRWAAAA
jgi:hypothetical protein